MSNSCRALTSAVATLALGGIAIGLAACNAQNDKPHAEPSHALPPIAEQHVDTHDKTAVHEMVDPMDPHAGDPHAGVDPHAGQEPHAQMAGEPHPTADQQMTPGGIDFDKKTLIAGSLKLADKTRDKVKPGDTIFVVVRGAGEGDVPGPVLAVRKLDAGVFPMPFQIDSRDAMIAGTAMKAPVTLTVRVDKDGDAMTKNPGDVVGQTTLKSLPQPKLALTLDTVL